MAGQIMFEIYRDRTDEGEYRVVYFTELEEHNKDSEIGRAMAGEHFYDGFIPPDCRAQARSMISEILSRLNSGIPVTPSDVASQLGALVADTAKREG